MLPTGAVCLAALFFVKIALLLTNNIEFDIIKALFYGEKHMAQKKGAGGKPQTYDEATGRYGTPAEMKRLKELGLDDTLTKRDWARIYERLGEIKRGGYIDTMPSGNKVIILHQMEDEDIPKVVIVGGTYDFPDIKDVLTFENEEDMFFAVGRLRDEFVKGKY